MVEVTINPLLMERSIFFIKFFSMNSIRNKIYFDCSRNQTPGHIIALHKMVRKRCNLFAILLTVVFTYK